MWPVSLNTPTELWQRFGLCARLLHLNYVIANLFFSMYWTTAEYYYSWSADMNGATKLQLLVRWHVDTKPFDNYYSIVKLHRLGWKGYALEKRKSHCCYYGALLVVTLALPFAVCWWHCPPAAFRAAVHGSRVCQLKKKEKSRQQLLDAIRRILSSAGNCCYDH
jgi:hypothetical protein